MGESRWTIRIDDKTRASITKAADLLGVTVGRLLADIAASGCLTQPHESEIDRIKRRLDALEAMSPDSRQAKPPRPSPVLVPTPKDGERQSGIGGVRTPISAEVIARIEALAAEGMGRRAIRLRLEAEGVYVSESTTEKYRSAWAKRAGQ
uniref:hypothetical protein n=1 Tax=Magnetospirillum sp. ME-1 TaxID=1639348 RepID=UPI001444BB63|nr:hypothetical protein [Magnetospirillum sp. ME-1]